MLRTLIFGFALLFSSSLYAGNISCHQNVAAAAVNHYGGVSAFRGGYNNFYANQKIAKFNFVQPYAIGVPVAGLGLEYYWTVGEELNLENQVDDVVNGLAGNEEFIDKLADKIAGKLGPVNTGTPNVGQVPSQPVAPTEPTLEDKLLTVVNKRCQNCHKTGNPIGEKEVLLYGDDGLNPELSPKDWYLMLKYVQWTDDLPKDFRMPKNAAEPLTNEEISLFREKFEKEWNK